MNKNGTSLMALRKNDSSNPNPVDVEINCAPTSLPIMLPADHRAGIPKAFMMRRPSPRHQWFFHAQAAPNRNRHCRQRQARISRRKFSRKPHVEGTCSMAGQCAEQRQPASFFNLPSTMPVFLDGQYTGLGE